MSIQIGSSYKFTRKTFLLKGVFVIQNSLVEVQEKQENNQFKVIYTDREGFQHIIEDVSADELVS